MSQNGDRSPSLQRDDGDDIQRSPSVHSRGSANSYHTRSRSSSVHRSPVYHRSRSRSHSRGHRKRERSYSRSRSGSYHRDRYSRSRSRSPYYKRRSRRSRSRSRGRRYSPRKERYDRRDYRSRSRSPDYRRKSYRDTSPMSNRRRHQGNRDNPEASSCLGSGRSRGFAFITFRNTDDAIEAKDRCTGIEIDGRRIRVDYSITERAHTPTPGVYLGKPTTRGYGRRRSPSPYYSRRSSRYSRSRSRSRSYSPR